MKTIIKSILKLKINSQLKLLIFLSIFLLSCNSENKTDIENTPNNDIQPTTEDYDFSKLQIRKIQNKVVLSGIIDVNPNDKIDVYSPYSGYIKKINIIEGDVLKKGDILFEVENIELAKLQSNFIELNNSFIQIKKEFERQDELFNKNAISEKIFLEHQTEYLNHINLIRIIKKELEYYGFKPNEILKNNEITNIIKIKTNDNVIVNKLNINTGKFVEKAQPLVGLYKTEHLHAELHAPEKYINLLNENDTVMIIHNKQTFTGYIYRVSKTIDKTTNMVLLHAHFYNNPNIPIGAFINGRIIFDKEVYSIENSAIFEKNGKEFITIYNNEEKKDYEVYTGLKDDKFTEIINYEDLMDKKIIIY